MIPLTACIMQRRQRGDSGRSFYHGPDAILEIMEWHKSMTGAGMQLYCGHPSGYVLEDLKSAPVCSKRSIFWRCGIGDLPTDIGADSAKANPKYLGRKKWKILSTNTVDIVK